MICLIEDLRTYLTYRGGPEYPAAARPRRVTYLEPVPPRLASNTTIESTFDVGRRFRCTMRVERGQLNPGAVIRPAPGDWHPRMPERLDDGEPADWRADRRCGSIGSPR